MQNLPNAGLSLRTAAHFSCLRCLSSRFTISTSFRLAHVLWSGQSTSRSRIMNAAALYSIIRTSFVEPVGWKRFQLSWQLALFLSPSPWSASSASLNGLSISRVTGHDCENAGRPLSMTVVTISMLQKFSLHHYHVRETLSRDCCVRTLKTTWRSIY